MQYQFKCKECEEQGKPLIFEVSQPIEAEHEANCPECGKPAQRLYSLLNWIWGGSTYRPDGSRREDKDYAEVMRRQ